MAGGRVSGVSRRTGLLVGIAWLVVIAALVAGNGSVAGLLSAVGGLLLMLVGVVSLIIDRRRSKNDE